MLSLLGKARIRQLDPACLGTWLQRNKQILIFVNIFDNDGFARTDNEACARLCQG